ncbi:MAG: amino acid adenylation domain-containing protein [Halanaerobiales bacterium]|nr:amino acid adenylation domain-containing protein [Halanaerobiales bacterium]
MNKIKKMDKFNIQDILELTPLQKGILYHYLSNPESEEYFEQLSLSLSGVLNEEMIEKNWSYIAENNEILRTIYKWNKLNKPVQIVLKKHVIPIYKHDFSKMVGVDDQKIICEIREKDLEKGIDLTKEPLRINLINLGQDKYEMIISYHHILFDGWSNAILLKEFITTYNNICERKKIVVKKKTHYKEFVKWCYKQDKTSQSIYWKKYLAGLNTRTILPVTKPKNKIGKLENIIFKFSKELTRKVYDFSKMTNVTIATLLYTTWGILLQKYNNSQDVVFGITVSGRNASITGIEEMVGLFINTLPLRVNAKDDEIVINILNQVNESLKIGEKYEQTPLVDIKSYSELGNSKKLFDSLVVIENYPMEKENFKENKYINVDSYSIIEKTNYQLTLGINIAESDIEFKFGYESGMFKEKTIENFYNHYRNILFSIVENVEIKLSDIDMLTDKEKNQILEEFNNIKIDYPKNKNITELFEEQVDKTPDKVAIVYENEELTYSELNEKAIQLARVLRDKRVNADKIVGIIVERSLEMIIGIMGILKAGGAYLPIDPEYPEERIRFMLADSNSKIVICGQQFADKFSVSKEEIELVYIDANSCYQGDNSTFTVYNKPIDLAYIIYTSGTTGHPKGIMIEHSGVVNLVTGLYHDIYQNYEESLRIALVAPYVFDASVKQIFASLLLGHSLYIVPEETRKDGLKLLTFLKEKKIEISDGTPAHISLLVTAMDNGEILPVKHFIIGGEALSSGVLKEFYQKFANYKPQVTNIYGPAECCVDSTSYLTDPKKLNQFSTIPIGKPLPNKRIYILDQNQCLSAKGLIGEIYIAGDGLARGYLNNPELTTDKFLADPFIPNQKMYRTGDLGRWLNDGNIEFVGRIDYQVKIRGYRIELGEIEAKLMEYQLIDKAVVIAKDDGKGMKYLCAYAEMKGRNSEVAELIIAKLRKFLTKKLPAYMVPIFFVILRKLPLTQNGKVDRKALPEPDWNVLTSEEYIAPRNKTEEKLVSIWQEILEIDKIGICDNFFNLGGHSLKATTLVLKIHKEFNVEVPLREVFNRPTIEELANYIEEARENVYLSIQPVEKREFYSVSSAQKRLLILNQLENFGVSYNMPGVMKIKGILDKEHLKEVLKDLVKRHESLRTYFDFIEGNPVQKIVDNVEFKVEEFIETNEDKVNKIIEKFIRPFDLKRAPLLRVGHIKMSEDNYLILFDMHHIISDGISMDILIKEFQNLYQGKDLPELRIQYKDFSVWQNELFDSGAIKKQEEYWLEKFLDDIPVLNMPTDYKRSSVPSYKGDSIEFVLNKDLTESLKEMILETNTTLYMVLLAVYNILLLKYTDQEDIIVGSPIAGRFHADLENIIGMFVNTLPMRIHPEGEKTFEKFLEEIKETTLEAYENQDYQFEMLVEKLNIERDMSRNPLFDVMFVLQNQAKPMFRLNDLEIKPYNFATGMSKFDLNLDAVESDNQLNFILTYSTELFKDETIERIAGHFCNIVSEVIFNPKVKLKDIEMISEVEKEELLYLVNDTVRQYPEHQTISQLFEAEVAKSPNKVAVTINDFEVTYGQLNQKINQLARFLRRKGIKPDTIVGLMLEHSLEAIIGIFGVLKAGGAYLPVDHNYPEQRINYLINNSGIDLLLIHEELKPKVTFSGELIDIGDNQIYQGDNSNLKQVCRPNNLVYLIYTSGSTGLPKGVMIEHRGLVNYAVWASRTYLSHEKSWTFPLYSSLSFDLTATSIFVPLISGNQIRVYGEYQDELLIKKILDEDKVDIIKLTPAHLQIIKDLEVKNKRLKKLIIGGEELKTDLAKRISDKFAQKIKIYNEYGPTETVIGCTVYTYQPDKDKSSSVPIGIPVDNVQIYLLDQNLYPVSVGVWGEIYISGAGVARGYLNHPDLTTEKFMENPFIPGERMYKTGDIARWLPDRNIEFFGRKDHQVKIRGYRIELGEIENQLLKHEAIDQTVVLAREEEYSKYLCVYVVGNREIKISELRDHLVRVLPDYMVPSYFIQLDNLPLNINGKVDRKALPEPDEKNITRIDYIGPRNKTEERLVSIWHEILRIDRIGINDNFFNLGGHSLKATTLVLKIHEEFNIEIPLREVFNRPTIKELNWYIQNTEEADQIRLELLNVKLKNMFGETCKLIKYKTEVYDVIILYTEKNSGEILNYIKNNSGEDILVDYVVDDYNVLKHNFVIQNVSLDELTDKIRLRHFDDNEIEKIFEVLRLNTQILQENILNKEKNYKYNIGGVMNQICRGNHKNNRRVYSNVISNFKNENLQNNLSILLNKLINEQPVFRTTICLEDETYKFVEHEKIDIINFNIIDLSQFNFISQRRIMERIFFFMESSLNDNSYLNSILFNFAIVKISMNRYYLILIMDHQVADIHTERIIKKYLEESYEENYKILPFKHYIKNVLLADNKNKFKIFNSSIILKEYKEAAESLYEKYSDYTVGKSIILSEPFVINYWFDDANFRKSSENINAFESLLFILVKILRIQFEVKMIPLRMPKNNRIFGEYSYYNTIGNFSDSIPCTFNTDHDTKNYYYKKYVEIDNFLVKHKIRLRELNDDTKISDYIFKLSPFSLNYLGDFESSKKNLTEEKIGRYSRLPYPVQAYTIDSSLLRIIFCNGIKKESLLVVEQLMKDLGGRYKYEFIEI